MRVLTPTQRLLCTSILLLPNRSVSGFSPPSRPSTPQQHRTTSLQAATLDSSFFDESTATNYAIESSQQQKRKFLLTTTITTYVTFFLQKITWEGAAADCADMIEASYKLNPMALGTALLSTLAAVKMMMTSSILSFSNVASWYLRQLEKSPLITKCITGGLISFFGDYGAQWFEYRCGRRKQLEMDRIRNGYDASNMVTASPRAGGLQEDTMSSRLSIRGTYNVRRGMARFLECLLISSPLMHYGYDLFEQIVPTTTAAASGMYACLAALSHVIADSVFLDGIFVMTGIIATGLLEGHPLRKVVPNLRNVYVPTLKASVMTSSALMPLQFLSFRFLPVQLRVLSVNAVDLIWTGVVSFVSHSDSNLEGGVVNA